jgi:chromosome partitioning protein
VASLDVDSRQQSLTHYLLNRERARQKHALELRLPTHATVPLSQSKNSEEAESEELQWFTKALAEVIYNHDFVVLDTPGSNSYLSRIAHSYADTLITPINDSFVDLDVLATIEPDTHKILGPGIYSDMVWKQKMLRASRDRRSTNWIVLRNRLSSIDAKNKRVMGEILEKLAQRIGFRHAPGFSERVIFRELFLQGITLLDLKHQQSPVTMNLSHVAARQELRDFLHFLQIPAITTRLSPEGTLVGRAQREEVPA